MVVEGKKLNIMTRLDIAVKVVDPPELYGKPVPFLGMFGLVPRSVVQAKVPSQISITEQVGDKFAWVQSGSGEGGQVVPADNISVVCKDGYYELGHVKYCPVHAVNEALLHPKGRCSKMSKMLKSREVEKARKKAAFEASSARRAELRRVNGKQAAKPAKKKKKPKAPEY